jgi:hypothetical protein
VQVAVVAQVVAEQDLVPVPAQEQQPQVLQEQEQKEQVMHLERSQ